MYSLRPGLDSYLFPRKWQKSRDAGFFYCFGQFSLMLGAGAGSSWGNYFRLTRNEATKQLNVLVIDFSYFLLAKMTGFRHICNLKRNILNVHSLFFLRSRGCAG